MIAFLGRFLSERSGATAIEYALLLAIVALAPMAAYGAVGDLVSGLVAQAAEPLVVAAPGTGIYVPPGQ